MPKYWMINDRDKGGIGPNPNIDGVTFWVSDKQPLTDLRNWQKVSAGNFQKLLVAAGEKFPALHGAYFLTDGTINLMRRILRGLDRNVLNTLGHTKGTASPAPA